MNRVIKSFLPLLLSLFSIQVMAQQSTIIVGWGETFESIANKYNITISELKAANPGKDKCFAGMEIIIPQPQIKPIGTKSITSPVVLRADSLLIEAKARSMSGKQNEAIKLYNRVIEMNVRTPYARAGRGECYFDLKKYKKAKVDLCFAINSGQLTLEEKNICEDALEDVEKAIQLRRERRNAAWAKVGLTLATVTAVTATAIVASEQSKAQSQQFNSSMPAKSVEGADHLRRADQIIAQSNANINQTRFQGTAQLNQYTQSMMIQAEQKKQRISEATIEEYKWRGEYEKNNGFPPNEAEVIQWYNSHYPDLTENYIMARGKEYEMTHKDEKKEKEEYKGELSPENYLKAYKGMEKNVQGWYNNLTTNGIKYEDKNGDIRGITTSDMKSYIYLGNQLGIKNAQREMRRIRLEAAKYGVQIPESKWETATSSY